MKIAVITNGGDTISQHFGRATHYLVATIENDQIINRELREKTNHYQLKDVSHNHDEPGQKHGFGKQSHEKQLRLVDAAIQQANWTTEIEVGGTVMQDYKTE